eukprot:COSAG04_NODE_12538_length_631_cov_0.559199_1_plen_53_part_10
MSGQREQDILGLEVAVHHALRVHILQQARNESQARAEILRAGLSLDTKAPSSS